MGQTRRRNATTSCMILTFVFIVIWIIITVFLLPFPLQTHHTNNISLQQTPKHHSLHDTSPSLWSKENRQIAWSKLMNGTGTIILIHARKAAGTTMDKWITSLIEDRIPFWRSKLHNMSWQCTLIKLEAFTNIHTKPKKNFIEHAMTQHPFAIYILALRDPIARILSQYDFEWRWGCIRCGPQRSNMKYNKIKQMNKTNYMKKVDNKHRIDREDRIRKYSNLDVHEFMDRIEKFEMNTTDVAHDGKHVRSYASYINNYYLWMFCCHSKFCNIYKDFEAKGKINECYELARQSIVSFDIVMVSEWLNDIRMQMFVQQLLFGECFDQRQMFVPLMSYPYPHRIHDRGSNYMIQQRDMDRLMEWNRWDIKLYQFTKQLVYYRQSHVTHVADLKFILLDLETDNDKLKAKYTTQTNHLKAEFEENASKMAQNDELN
eukprot:34933_1